MTESHFVLSVHPCARGLGWAVFEGSRALFDCGSVAIQGNGKNAKTLAAAEKLTTKYRPRALVLEAFDHPLSQRKARIRAVCRSMIRKAERRGIVVHCYTRQEIASALGVTSAKQRYAVAEAVATRIESLRPRLPRPKKIWLGERHHMGLFCAVACGLTHFSHTQPMPMHRP